MKFGFAQIPGEHYSNHIELVKAGEKLGFDFAWMTDQTFFRDPYVLMSLALEATERIRLGVGVTNAYTRHPAMTARTVATMNELGPGRVCLGIGAGNRQELLEPLGIYGDHQAPRIKETVAMWRQLLSGERTSFRGEHYVADGVELLTAPAPDVPIYIGGRGPQIMRTAGEIADGAIIGGLCTPSGMSYALDAISKGAQRGHRDLSDLDVVCWVTCFLTDDPRDRRESIKPWIAHFIGEAPQRVLDAVGLDRGTVDTIKTSYEKAGSGGATQRVTDECIDGFSLITDPASAADRVEDLRDAGVTQFSILLPTGTVADHHVQLERFAEAVFPRFSPRG